MQASIYDEFVKLKFSTWLYSPATSFAGELVGPPVVMVMREKDKGSYTGSQDVLNIKAGDIINVTWVICVLHKACYCVVQMFSVKNVQQLQMDIRAGIMRGRVHITQVLDKPLQVCVLYSGWLGDFHDFHKSVAIYENLEYLLKNFIKRL